MIQPDELKKNEPLVWSTGIGTDVWELFCAAIAGDLESVKRLVTKDPSIVRMPVRVPHAAVLRGAGESDRGGEISAGERGRSAEPGGERQLARDLPRPRLRGDGEAAGGKACERTWRLRRKAK